VGYGLMGAAVYVMAQFLYAEQFKRKLQNGPK
jgi:hypothetical protein